MTTYTGVSWLLNTGWDRDGRDRRQGRDVRAGLRGAQGGLADKVPADGGADAGRGQLDREDQEGRRLMLHQQSIRTSMCSCSGFG